MDTTLHTSQNKAMFVPAELSVLGIVEGQRLPMHVEEIGRTGLFMISREFVAPRTIFEILLKLPGEAAPIYALVSATFVERRGEGYGIAARITTISSRSHTRWQRVHERCVAASTQPHRPTFCLERLAQPQTIVMLHGALPNGVRSSLHYFGVTVKMAWTVDEAFELARRNDAKLIIGFHSERQNSGHALCQKLEAQGRSPALMLISEIDGFAASAAQAQGDKIRVVAWPCSQAMLVTRILALLANGQASREATLAARADASLSSINDWFEQLVHLWALHHV